MFAMACIDRQNELDRLKYEKANDATLRDAAKSKKKELEGMMADGSLQRIVKRMRENGQFKYQSFECPVCSGKHGVTDRLSSV